MSKYYRKVGRHQVHAVDKDALKEIGKLRQCGYAYQDLSQVGQGCPDGICSYGGETLMIEWKSEGKTLNELQVEWHSKWKGKVVVAVKAEQVIMAMNAIVKKGGRNGI